MLVHFLGVGCHVFKRRADSPFITHKFNHAKKINMNEFLLVIHRDLTSKDASPSPEQMQAAIKPFQDWIGGIAAQNKLVSPPTRWDAGGRVIKQNTVINGPYAEVKESVGGLLRIRANDYDEAVEIAKGCPIIQWGAVVEVRMAVPTP